MPFRPSFRTVKELLSKITDEEKNTLFYWSCLDPSMWGEFPTILPDPKIGKKKILKILEKHPGIKEKYIAKRPDKIYEQLIESEDMTNYMLAYEISMALIKRGFSVSIDVSHLNKREFPDIIMDIEGERINIEIKSLISASSLAGRIIDEGIIKKLKKNHKDFRKFILLLIFPFCLGHENPKRINQLVEGFYVYKRIIPKSGSIKGKRIPFKRKVLCACVCEKTQGFDMNTLLERIVERSIMKIK